MRIDAELSFLGADIELDSNFEVDVNFTKIPIQDSPERIKNSIVCIVLEGTALVLIDGVRYTLKMGAILSVFPHQVVEELSRDANFRLMYFTCTMEILSRILFRFPPSFVLFLKEYPFYALPNQVYEYNKTLINLLFEKCQDKTNITRNSIILNYLQIFFMEIYNKIHQKIEVSAVKQLRHHEVFWNFINMLPQESKKSREVQHYAEKLNISPKYLSVITQSVSKQGAKKIIDNFIVMEVKLLLKSTSLSMKEVSNTFNFPDQAFFCKFFKNQTGYTPIEYRSL